MAKKYGEPQKLEEGVLPIKTIVNKLKVLKSERANWEREWQDITDLMFPRRNSIITKKTEGERKTSQIYDNTAIVSNELLAGTLHGMMTSPNALWFGFTTGSTELDRDDEVRAYLQECARRLHVLLNNTNFQTEVHEYYLDLGAINTGNILIEEVEGPELVRFATQFIADYYIDEDYLGRVNQVYKEWKWDSQKIIDAFGYENVPEKIRSCHDTGKHETFCMIHAVYPESMLPNPKKTQKPIISQYALPDLEVNLKVERFYEMPYVVPRWSKASGEKYGRGPGMNAIAEVKSLNKMAEVTLKGAQKVVDPPLAVPDDGFIMPLRTKPASLNYYRAGSGGPEMIRPIFNDTRIDFGFQAMSEKRNRVKEAFYIDQLTSPVGGPQRTATEVMQRAEEQMRLMGPMVGRQETEFLRPTIDRVFGIANRRGYLPPAPLKLQGRKIDVRYTSLIARTQRASEANSIIRTMQTVAPLSAISQSVFDNVNTDAAFRVIAEINGLPQEIINTKVEVQRRRDARAQAQVQAQQQQQQVAETAMFNDTAETISKVTGG